MGGGPGRPRGRAAVWGRGIARTRPRERLRPLPARRGRPRLRLIPAVTGVMRGLASKLARGAAPEAAVPAGSRPAPRPPPLGTAPAPSGSARVRSLKARNSPQSNSQERFQTCRAKPLVQLKEVRGKLGAGRAAQPVALPLGRKRRQVLVRALPPAPGQGPLSPADSLVRPSATDCPEFIPSLVRKINNAR